MLRCDLYGRQMLLRKAKCGGRRELPAGVVTDLACVAVDGPGCVTLRVQDRDVPVLMSRVVAYALRFRACVEVSSYQDRWTTLGEAQSAKLLGAKAACRVSALTWVHFRNHGLVFTSVRVERSGRGAVTAMARGEALRVRVHRILRRFLACQGSYAAEAPAPQQIPRVCSAEFGCNFVRVPTTAEYVRDCAVFLAESEIFDPRRCIELYATVVPRGTFLHRRGDPAAGRASASPRRRCVLMRTLPPDSLRPLADPPSVGIVVAEESYSSGTPGSMAPPQTAVCAPNAERAA